jgi:hypothetical protein
LLLRSQRLRHNLTHQEYVDSIKKVAISAGKKVLIEAVAKKLPFLFIPVIGPIVSLLLGKIVEILISETEFALFFGYIDLRIDAQGRAFSEAAILNHYTQIHGSPNEKLASEKALIEKFRAFAIIRN